MAVSRFVIDKASCLYSFLQNMMPWHGRYKNNQIDWILPGEKGHFVFVVLDNRQSEIVIFSVLNW